MMPMAPTDRLTQVTGRTRSFSGFFPLFSFFFFFSFYYFFSLFSCRVRWLALSRTLGSITAGVWVIFMAKVLIPLFFFFEFLFFVSIKAQFFCSVWLNFYSKASVSHLRLLLPLLHYCCLYVLIQPASSTCSPATLVDMVAKHFGPLYLLLNSHGDCALNARCIPRTSTTRSVPSSEALEYCSVCPRLVIDAPLLSPPFPRRQWSVRSSRLY